MSMHESFKMCGLLTCHGAKLMFDEKGQVPWVHCMVCTFVEKKEKLLAPKLNNLLKHQGHYKAKVSMPRVNANSFYFNKDYVHVKNECCYATTDHPSIWDQLQANVSFETKTKICPICCYFPSPYPWTSHV